MQPLSVCVVGCGYVGLVTGACLAEIGHHVTCVDSDRSKIEALLGGRIPIYEPGLDAIVTRQVRNKRLAFAYSLQEGMKGAHVVFIAVGTPPRPDGSADLSFIEDVAKDIARHLKSYTVIAEKSTVPVQTGEDVERIISRFNRNKVAFDVVSNPEFLREGTAVGDFLKPDRIVIGSKSKRASALMGKLYAPLKARMIYTDLKSAELIKHASNSFLATKISYINAVSRVCERVGADAKMVAEGMGLDPRIGPAFLHPGIGFGGFCLPKDLEAFHYISRCVGYEFDLLKAVRAVNKEQPGHFVKKIEKSVGSLRGKTIAVLGLAFKPNTDDIRFAPAFDVINQLHQKGARVRVFDPVAMPKAKRQLPNVDFASSAYEVLHKADALALVTEWPAFRKLNFSKMKKLMRRAIIVDGRNLFDGAQARKAGFAYTGMGRFS